MAVAAVLVTSILWGTTGTAATFAPTAGPLAIAAASLGVGGLLAAVGIEWVTRYSSGPVAVTHSSSR